MDAQPDHEHKDTSHAQKVQAGLELDKKQDECRSGGGQKPREKVKELVYVVIWDHLVQDHQKNNTADIERVFAFLDGRQKNGTDHSQVFQDQKKDDGDNDRKDKNGDYIPALHLQSAVGSNKKIKNGAPNGDEQRVKNVRDDVVEMAHQICFLSLATGMPSCSRYLATVRLAMG